VAVAMLAQKRQRRTDYPMRAEDVSLELQANIVSEQKPFEVLVVRAVRTNGPRPINQPARACFGLYRSLRPSIP
jgi:hypothetical protein